jgi:hypothetical protein
LHPLSIPPHRGFLSVIVPKVIGHYRTTSLTHLSIVWEGCHAAMQAAKKRRLEELSTTQERVRVACPVNIVNRAAPDFSDPAFRDQMELERRNFLFLSSSSSLCVCLATFDCIRGRFPKSFRNKRPVPLPTFGPKLVSQPCINSGHDGFSTSDAEYQPQYRDAVWSYQVDSCLAD